MRAAAKPKRVRYWALPGQRAHPDTILSVVWFLVGAFLVTLWSDREAAE